MISRFIGLKALVFSVCLTPYAVNAETPKLIVQLTIDGFRADFLDRYMSRFGPNGFKRLIETGVWYKDAHHLHANTETIVGHATLATGAHPSEHGMIGNAWFDRADGRLVYNIEDPLFPMIPIPGFGGEGDQVDPTQAAAQSNGRSPINLLATTFGDELSKANNGRSRVIGISGKDRSAVAMAGHVGDAYWMSTSTGAFETSRYYHDAYPQWVLDWNAAHPADAMIGKSWELAAPAETYLMAENDDRPYETDLRGFGRTFPHEYGIPKDGLYYTQVLLSSFGDQITADFAKAAVLGEGLGQDDFPDLLSVSFSGVDATNHFFGPSSLENEEIVRALDRSLADFMAFLDETVGKEAVLYVLSADHGMPEIVEFMQEKGFSTARNLNNDLKDELNLMIEDKFGVREAIQAFFRPYIYLDQTKLAVAGAQTRAIERAIVDELMSRDGIALAMPAIPFPEQEGDLHEGPIRRNFHPRRSGDIYVVQSPYAFLFDKGPLAAMHGSPWRYDTHVPILFSGSGMEQRTITRKVATVDIAVTLATLFGTTQPSGAAGEVLIEVME